MANTPSSTSTPFKNIADLPYDILFDIFHLLSSHDLVHLLSCCRDLRSYVDQEHIWQTLSAPYGLHDITYFGGRSWYIVYTRLLHSYGPMLGLWASDHAFIGGILEFYLHRGDDERVGGIVIDAWQFRLVQPEDLDAEPERPEPPIHAPLGRIDFSATPTLYGDARVMCCSKRGVGIHPGQMRYLSSTSQGLFLHAREGRYAHPEFPDPDNQQWVDHRRYPRLPCVQAQVVDQSVVATTGRPRIPIIFTAPTNYRKPPAISLTCRHGCIGRIRPFLGFDNAVPHLPRYYPLRRHVPPVVDITSPDWQPSALSGLWLGSHGPHGTELLYVYWDRLSSVLRAWKITGDENVPRGALTWEVHTGTPYVLSHVPSYAMAQGIGDLSKYRLFGGTGVISARGFM